MKKEERKISSFALAFALSFGSALLFLLGATTSWPSTADNSERNQFGEDGDPAPEALVRLLRVYAKHNAPVGLFGEATQDFLVSDAFDLNVVGMVIATIGYVAAADGMTTAEENFLVDAFYEIEQRTHSIAHLRAELKNTATKQQAVDFLRKDASIMKLYWIAVFVAVDGISEPEMERLRELIDEVPIKDAHKVIRAIEMETTLRNLLMEIMTA